MKITLDPIIPPVQVERDIESAITDWLWNNVYGPLFAIFDLPRPNYDETSAVSNPMSAGGPNTANKNQPLTFNNDTGDWKPFPAEYDSLGIPRSTMPQIERAMQPVLEEYLKDRGISSTRIRTNATAFKPSQSHYSETKYQHWARQNEGNQAILVSSDMRILDGHHQWFAARNNDGPQREIDAIQFNANVPTLIKAMWEFPHVCRDNAAEYPAVSMAIQTRQIQYADGVFSGTFTAAISRELKGLGATFSARDKTYRLARNRIPYSLRGSIAAAQFQADALQQQLLFRTGQIADLAASTTGLAATLSGIADQLVRSINDQFNASVRKAMGGVVDTDNPMTALEIITVPPDFKDSVVEDVRATLTHNVELSIRDFTAEQMVEVRQMAEKLWQEGTRLDQLEQELQERFGIAQRKAKFLAKQETSMIAAEYSRARAEERGSTEYVWHTREDDWVRPDHEVLDMTTQKWDEPPVVDKKRGRHAHPGMDYNCLPGDCPINFFDGVRVAFRRRYRGNLTKIVTESGKTFRATPNHPVLTHRGWKPIGILNQSDYVVEIAEQRGITVKTDNQNGVPSISEIFETLRETGKGETFHGEADQFHGDGSDDEVNVVRTAGPLSFMRKTEIGDTLRQLILAETETLTLGFSSLLQHSGALFLWNSFCARVRVGGQSLFLLKRHSAHSQGVGFRSGSSYDPRFPQSARDYDSRNPRSLRDRKFTLSGKIRVDDRLWIELKAIRGFAFTRVSDVRTEAFDGHVFNLETNRGYYATGNVVVSNCRCIARPILSIANKLARDAA